MPVPNDAAAQAREAQAKQSLLLPQGRESTDLTGPNRNAGVGTVLGK
jgi:hypothetical protein